MNHSYPTTMYENILAQIYVFPVLLTIFAFYHENEFKQKLQKNVFTRNIYILAKILSYIVVG